LNCMSMLSQDLNMAMVTQVIEKSLRRYSLL
jgi:hypothetical protein